ncbi:MAG: SOS response-associated peptidase family protein [Blautia wexlerae]
MCSRYYIDPGMTEDISRVVQNIEWEDPELATGRCPSDRCRYQIIGQSEHGLELGICRWGYPLSKSKGLVINARVETVLDKPSFQNGILYHRLLIPAGGFYEWNS